MANWTTIKEAIASVIKTNGNQEITGVILQNTLNSIINSIGENATFAGVAIPTTNPGTPDGPTFYIATTAGSYSNFGSIKVLKGESAILRWNNGVWAKNTFKPMTDFNSVFNANGKSLTEFEREITYDVSANNNDAVFKSLQTLLSSSNLNTLIPLSVRHGGMSIKFIQGSVPNYDNKYVQYRLTSNEWSYDISDWRSNDDIIDEITEKTVIQSPNIINPATTVQYAVNSATGKLLVTPIYADYRTTDYISVSEGDIFVFNNNVYENRYATYDSSRECVPKDASYVSLITYAGTYDGQSYNYTGRRVIDNKYGVLVIPNGVSYIRVCAASQADMNGAMLIKIGTISEMLSSELSEANKKVNTAPVFYAAFILGSDYDLNSAEYIPYGTTITYAVKGISDVEKDIDGVEDRLDVLEPKVSNIEGYIADKDSEPVEDSQKMIDSGGVFNGMIGLKTILGYSEQTVNSPNIYNKTTNVYGFYLNPKIETPVTNASYCYSQKIDVTPGKIILYNKSAIYSFFHMYDVNGDFVAAADVNDTLYKLTPANRSNDDSVWSYFTVPSGVYAMQFSGAITDMNVAMFILIDDLSEMGDYDIGTYIPYGTYKKCNSSVLNEMSGELGGKKIIVIGDSMVYGNTVGEKNTWSAKIAEKIGLDYVVSSSGITSKTENVMVNAGVNGVMLSNNNAPFASNISDAVINRYSGMDSNADYVVVFAGTNDAWALSRNEIQLGETDSVDDTTFNGALNVLMQGLLTKYPSGKIAFITPYIAPSSNAGAASREAIINAIKAACIRNGGIPCFDNSIRGGIDWNNTAQKTALTQNDGTHLNTTGHAWVSTKYKAFMESL